MMTKPALEAFKPSAAAARSIELCEVIKYPLDEQSKIFLKFFSQKFNGILNLNTQEGAQIFEKGWKGSKVFFWVSRV